MSNRFKQQAAQQRAAVPQIDLESVKVELPSPAQAPVAKSAPSPAAGPVERTKELTVDMDAILDKGRKQNLEMALAHQELSQMQRITQVDTNETPTNRGFAMYPSRHRQVAKDLAYIEDRKPWQIIDDALEEYVIKHYGKEYKRN